jgi:hypothetical protein
MLAASLDISWNRTTKIRLDDARTAADASAVLADGEVTGISRDSVTSADATIYL